MTSAPAVTSANGRSGRYVPNVATWIAKKSGPDLDHDRDAVRAHGTLAFALANQVSAATSFAVQKAYFKHSVFMALNTGTLLLRVGMLLLGAGVLRSRVLPRRAGTTLLLSPITVHAAFILNLPTYVHGLPFLAGMTVFGWAVLRAAEPLAVDRT